jgi:hypothetical protein
MIMNINFSFSLAKCYRQLGVHNVRIQKGEEKNNFGQFPENV